MPSCMHACMHVSLSESLSVCVCIYIYIYVCVSCVCGCTCAHAVPMLALACLHGVRPPCLTRSSCMRGSQDYKD